MRHTITTAVAWLLLTAIVRAELPELIVLGHNRCTQSRIVMTDLLSPAFQTELARECRVKFVGPVGETYKRLNPARVPAFYLDGQFLFDGYSGPTHLLQAVQQAKADHAPIGGHTPPVTPAVAPPPPTSPAPTQAMPLDVGLRNRVTALEERVQTLWQWPPPETIAGPPGPPGPPGKDGRPGPPGLNAIATGGIAGSGLLPWVVNTIAGLATIEVGGPLAIVLGAIGLWRSFRSRTPTGQRSPPPSRPPSPPRATPVPRPTAAPVNSSPETVTRTQYVEVPNNDFAEAWAYASKELGHNEPGSRPIILRLQGLMDQHLSGPKR